MKTFLGKGTAFLLGMVLLTSTARAEGPIDFSLGIQGGVNFADFDPSVGTRTGMALGGHLEMNLIPMLYLQPEVIYLQKGASTSTNTWKFDSVEIPLLLKGKFGTSEMSAEIFGGPSVGILVSRKRAPSAAGSSDVDLTGTTKGLDFGLQFGAGADFNVGVGTSIFINARYLLGLTNLNNDPTITVTSKTKGILIVGGVRFFL